MNKPAFRPEVLPFAPLRESPFASFWGRYAATVVDLTFQYGVQFSGAIFGALLAASFTMDGMDAETARDTIRSGAALGNLFWGFAGYFLNSVVLQGLTGASVGKWIFNYRVVTQDGRPLGVTRMIQRAGAHLLSALPFFAGYLVVLWDRRRQAWHDRLAHSFVVKQAALKNWSGNVGSSALLPAPAVLLTDDSERRAA